MAMLHQFATRDNTQATEGTFDNIIPNTEPTDAAYVAWKAKLYTPATANRGLYNLAHQFRYHKILKRNSKLGETAMEA
jgi:hypothetical protein